jgi:hypothetical protein
LSSAASSLAVNATFVAATLSSSCGQMQGGRREAGRMPASALLCLINSVAVPIIAPGPVRECRADRRCRGR